MGPSARPGRKPAVLPEHRLVKSAGVWLKRVYEDAERSDCLGIRWASVAQIQEQMDIPKHAVRVVVAVDSGTTLLGLIRGLRYRGEATPILGVVVGASPGATLDRYASYWREQVTLRRSPAPYHSPAKKTRRFGIWFDPYYEAKCLPYLKRGDCLVVVVRRSRQDTRRQSADGASWSVTSKAPRGRCAGAPVRCGPAA